MDYVRDGDLILFQGDSITDSGRRDDPLQLGSGYVAMVTGLLPVVRGDLRLRVLNRGVGGDRTVELLERWKADCEDIKPSVLSIKIGVNDVWRILGEWNGQTYVTPEEYRANYRKLLDRACAAGIRQLVLCSPTTIENGKNARVAELIAGRVEITKALAAEYRALYVPFNECQARLLADRPDVAWTLDGCHPSPSGHAALAWCWLNAAFN